MKYAEDRYAREACFLWQHSLLFIAVFLVGYIPILDGQDLQRRYSFARSYFGIDAIFVPDAGQSAYLDAAGDRVVFDRSPFLTPAINIGASHFWGYADFYVSITTPPISTGQAPVASATRFGTLTGLRLYPWQLNRSKVRPFLGYKFAPIRYRQEDRSGADFRATNIRSILDLGLAYQTNNMYWYLAFNRLLNSEMDVYLSRSERITSGYPTYFLNLGVNWTLETTAGSFPESSREMDALLSRKNVAGLFLGIGPSAAFPTASSIYIERQRPYLDDRAMPGIFPDLSLGYHFTRQDFIMNLAFRPMRQRRAAFDFEQLISRNSFSLETYKFLFDYHGFAPFVGAGVSREWIRVRESEGEVSFADQQYRLFQPILVFGWDIRPGFLSDAWLLRTNLRYSPQLNITYQDQSISLSYLEFNFIQFVYYPQRVRMYRK